VTRGIPWSFGLSFDGTQLAVGNQGGKDLVLKAVPAAGGPSREIFRDSTFQMVGAPDWMPDGQHVILNPSSTSERGTATGYLIVPVGGGAARDIGIAPSRDGQFPTGFGMLRVHPNGRQLVYVAQRERPLQRTVGNLGPGELPAQDDEVGPFGDRGGGRSGCVPQDATAGREPLDGLPSGAGTPQWKYAEIEKAQLLPHQPHSGSWRRVHRSRASAARLHFVRRDSHRSLAECARSDRAAPGESRRSQ